MRPIARLIINRVAAFIVFLLLVIVLNILVSYTRLSFFQSIVDFINNNILFLGLIALVVVLGEIFGMLKFPFNLPYPIFSAVGVLFIIYFVFDIFDLLVEISSVDINIPFSIIFKVIAIFVFLAILITGYCHIFRNRPEKPNGEKPRQERKPKKKQIKKKVVKKTKKK